MHSKHHPHFTPSSTLYIGLLVALVMAGTLRGAPFPFADDFESGLLNWTTNGLWGRTTNGFASPVHAATDTPGSFYVNQSDSALTMASSVSLAGVVRPALSFHHAFFLEHSYDFGRVEVSLDGGANWVQPVLAAYTGVQAEMVREQLDLGAYAGATDLRLRFRLITDDSVVMDGWYVDDVRLGVAPAAINLNTPSASGPNSVPLSWTASTAPGITGSSAKKFGICITLLSRSWNGSQLRG